MTLDVLRTRLQDPNPAVRRIAAMDLARLADPHSPQVAFERLAHETDRAALLHLIRLIERTAFAPAHAALARLRDDPATDVHIAHAALLAADAIELAARDHQIPCSRSAADT